MTINYTTLLGLAKPVTGTETGQWGDIVNDEITSLLEDSIAKAVTLSVTSANVTLTTTNGATNQARVATLIITGTPGITRNIIAPSQSKIYQVINQSDSSVVIKGAATTGVTILAGASGVVAWNGSDFIEIGAIASNRTINGALQLSAGTAAAPSLTTTGDTNTGLYFPAADTVAIATGGVKRVEVDANGNLGIATTSPTSKLHVKGSFRIESEGAQWFSISAGLTGASYGAFYKGGITTLVGLIGTDGGGIVGGGTGDNFGIRAESALLLAAGATERARITSDGNLLVGTTGADPIGGRYNGVVLGSGGNLDIRHASNTSDWGISSTSGTIVNFYSDNGSAAVFAGFISVNGNTTSYASVSDYRLKENIQPMTGALAKVAQLKPCTYNWKADGSDGQGFIAHELQAVFPDAVTGEKDAVDAEGNPKYQGIDTSFLVATLTAALQEAHGLIKDLQSRVDALEAK